MHWTNLAHGLISPCKVASLIEFFAKNESELFFRKVLKQKPDYNFTLFSLLNSRCKWANRWREKVQSFLKRPPLDQQNGQALLVVRSSSISWPALEFWVYLSNWGFFGHFSNSKNLYQHKTGFIESKHKMA